MFIWFVSSLDTTEYSDIENDYATWRCDCLTNSGSASEASMNRKEHKNTGKGSVWQGLDNLQ